jgi:indolepyruvate ferredoxin oxidoreductase
MAIDPRFLAESGLEVFSGNDLLVKGALETDGGVHLLTGYPGSPIAGFFDVLSDLAPLLKQHGIRAFQANNEALGAAAVNGSQMGPYRAIAAMKNVGVHVASDALALGTLAGAHPQGGALIIMGEDPWCDSTQVPADSRFLCQHLRMPVVEPGTPQELKDWINLSFRLSQSAGLYIGYIVTVAQADGGGTVLCKPNQFPSVNTNSRVALPTEKIDLEKVLLPPRTWRQELKMPQRLADTIAAARALGINRIIPSTFQWSSPAPLGFIVTGMGGPYLQHVLAEIGLEGAFPVLQMGMSYPADASLLAEFGRVCQTMVVIEERRSFLEQNLREALFQTLPHEQATALSAHLYGKRLPSIAGDTEGIPDTRGLNFSVLAQKLIPLIQATDAIPGDMRNGRLSQELDRLRQASRARLAMFNDAVVARTPTFCPGCPHRDSSGTLLEVRRNIADPAYMGRHHPGKPAVQLVAHGDTGCYTMLMYPPTQQLMHNYSGMGLGGGTGSGIDPFITNKQLVFMGDGTFFHSGAIAISNSIKAGQDITYIILENKTTAMTGHQEHAGTETNLLGFHNTAQDIEQILRGMGGSGGLTVVRLSPADRTAYKAALESAILADGVKVVIADKECGITHHRTRLLDERRQIKERGYLPSKTHMNITPEVCENCLECTKATACPGLTSIETDYGRKIDTDLTWCVNDGACERVRVSHDSAESVKPCPSFEQVTVLRAKRRRYMLPHMGLDKLPEPVLVNDMQKPGAVWRAHLSGVGGMGIGVVGAILVRAGHKEGFHLTFQEKKGLAIRNGGVFSQITFVSKTKEAAKVTGSIPYGKADLLLGIDILEAARAIDPREQFRVASSGHTAAVLNTHKQATVNVLLGEQDFDPQTLSRQILESCDADHFFAKNLSEICEQRLGSKQFVNILMLGVAYQLGLIPVSARSIAWAIKDTIRREHRRNLKAFNIGRKLALEPRALPMKPEPETWQQLLTNKTRVLKKSRWFGRSASTRLEMLVRTAMRNMRDLPDQSKYDLALRVYDIMQFQDHHLARRYVELIRNVYRRDQTAHQYAATTAAIWNLAKVILIKDEPYVSYLLTRYEKKQRDITKYGIDAANGDRLVYRHHTSPEFNIGRRRIRLRVTTRDWHLKLVSRMKWWRKLPGWHVRECAFRDWYIGLLDSVDLSTPDGYAQALRALKCPEQVTGYREVRYPKMDAARAAVELDFGSQPAPAVALQPAREPVPADVP